MSTIPEQARYTLPELAALAGVTPRTVRYYIAQGLLPPAPSSGPGAKYGDAHLARLRLIRRFQRDHHPLASIRQQLDRLDDKTVVLLDTEPIEKRSPTDSALDYVRRLLAPSSAAPATPSSAAPAPSSVAPSPSASVAPASVAPSASVAPAPSVAPSPPAASTTGPAPEPTEPARSQWERIVLGPDVELHVRRPLTRSQSKRVDRLVAIGRELLEEDPT